jgi:hypothetical protein
MRNSRHGIPAFMRGRMSNETGQRGAWWHGSVASTEQAFVMRCPTQLVAFLLALQSFRNPLFLRGIVAADGSQKNIKRCLHMF